MTKSFDVFLSHNRKDKPAVLELAKALRNRGLEVWLDKWELVPGRPWQEALEEVIETCRSSAVLVGKDGLGPWHAAEMRGCLTEFVRRELPVIPVLLPGAPAEPKLPLFLTQVTWVDLRTGLTEEGLDELQWGITGRRPDRSKSPSTPSATPEAATVSKAPLTKVQPASELTDRASPWPLLKEENRDEASQVETTKPAASRTEDRQGGAYIPTAAWWVKNRLKAGIAATIMLIGFGVSYFTLQNWDPALQAERALRERPLGIIAQAEEITLELGDVGVRPTNPGFTVLAEDRIWDLRSLRVSSDSSYVVGPAYMTRYTDLRRADESAVEYTYRFETAGPIRAWVMNTDSRLRFRLIGQPEGSSPQAFSGSKILNAYDCIVECSRVPVNKPFTVIIQAQYNDAFLRRENWWVGAIAQDQMERVSMRVVFPAHLPFQNPSFRRYTNGSRLESVPFEGKIINAGGQSELLWTAIPPISGSVYRVNWDWYP